MGEAVAVDGRIGTRRIGAARLMVAGQDGAIGRGQRDGPDADHG